MTTPPDLKSRKSELSEAYVRACPDDFLLFVGGLHIPAAYGRRLFGSCMQPFQLDCFESIAPTLHALRDGEMPEKQRFWIERTKGAAKDSDLAICLLWLVAFARRPFKCQVVASNSKQAGIVENRAVELLYHNPWLKEYVEIIQRHIRNRKMPREVWVHIEATGTSGQAHGEAPELLVVNELVHVDRWSVVESHMNNADKVAMGAVFVFTNAGIKGTPAEKLRKKALANRSLWTIKIWDKVAPWIRKKFIQDAKDRDPIGSEYARLWEGKWISGMGDAVSQDAIDRCFRLKGPLAKPEPGWLYLMAFDMGETHDHSGTVAIGVNPEEQRIKVARLKGWVPILPNDKGVLEVDADDVERVCLLWAREFAVVWFGYDPAAGGRFIAQRLRKQGIPMFDMTFGSPANQTAMATSFVQVMNNGTLECYDDEEGRMRRDFGKFSIEPKVPVGYKLTAVSDEYGHADVGTALVICLPMAIELMGGLPAFSGPLVASDEPLSEDELGEMPDDLRDIYDSCGPPEGDRVSHKNHWDDREF